MSKRLQGKVAVITGAASGIGAATAQRFKDEGCLLVLADIQSELGRDFASNWVITSILRPATLVLKLM